MFLDSYVDRIVPVTGDLRSSRFGLTKEKWNELAELIDVIYHIGAHVNHGML